MASDREFRGVFIPARIYLAKDISWIQKIILCEINSFDENGKGCFASYEHFARLTGVAAGTIKNLISDLKQKGYIENTYFDGRKQWRRVSRDKWSEYAEDEDTPPDDTDLPPQPSRIRDGRPHENVRPASIKPLQQPVRNRTTTNTNTNSSTNTNNTNTCANDCADELFQKDEPVLVIPNLEQLINHFKKMGWAPAVSKHQAEVFLSFYEKHGWLTVTDWQAEANKWKAQRDHDTSFQHEVHVANPKEQAFERWWDAYDKKKDRERAKKIFMKLGTADIEAIELHTPRYVQSTPTKQYRKDPSTYLNDKAWHNEVIAREVPMFGGKQQKTLEEKNWESAETIRLGMEKKEREKGQIKFGL